MWDALNKEREELKHKLQEAELSFVINRHLKMQSYLNKENLILTQ
ncbi:MAG: hypothetical protein JWQ54_2979 [Mucilaginibacter sp.]|nr:hypothetical protein [Mucilaginibacter sp.]